MNSPELQQLINSYPNKSGGVFSYSLLGLAFVIVVLIYILFIKTAASNEAKVRIRKMLLIPVALVVASLVFSVSSSVSYSAKVEDWDAKLDSYYQTLPETQLGVLDYDVVGRHDGTVVVENDFDGKSSLLNITEVKTTRNFKPYVTAKRVEGLDKIGTEDGWYAVTLYVPDNSWK